MRPCRLPRLLALGGYLALVLLLIAWIGWLAPPLSLPRSLALLLGVGPLMLPLRGLLHGRAYTHAWVSLLVLAYLAHGLVELYASPTQRLWAALEVAASSLLFGGAVAYVRCRRRG